MGKTCSGSHPPGPTKKQACCGRTTSPTVFPGDTPDKLISKTLAHSTSFDKTTKRPKSLLLAPNPRYLTLSFAGGSDWEARFGATLLVADMNGDGVADIAVSSPFSYGRDQEYPLAGKVEVFFLNK